MFEGQPRARRKKKYTGQHADRLERRDADAEVAQTGRGIGLTIRDRDDFPSPTGSRQLLQRSLDTGLTDKRVEQPGLADSPGRDTSRVRERERRAREIEGTIQARPVASATGSTIVGITMGIVLLPVEPRVLRGRC